MDLCETARRCSAIATANGFDVTTWENLPAKILFTITELDEGRDGVLGTGADPLGEELADTAIRIMCALHDLDAGNWFSRVEGRRSSRGPFAPIEVLLWPTLGHLCKAAERWRYDDQRDTLIHLELALLETYRAADRAGVDLDVAIKAKCRKNEKRGYLHGKRRSAG